MTKIGVCDHDERELLFAPKEFDLLWLLASRPEQVHTPETLYRAVWGGERWGDG